jgi:hypothetical protein
MKTAEQVVTVESNGLDVASVHPNNGHKYSPNLYRWLTMRGREFHAWTSRIYRSADGVLWIGMFVDGDLLGARLMNVLCYGKKAEDACWVSLRDMVEIADFWARYMRDGRCAIDTEHEQYFIGDETRWTTVGEKRTCNWCGKYTQVLARWTEAVDQEEWRAVKPDEAAASATVGG